MFTPVRRLPNTGIVCYFTSRFENVWAKKKQQQQSDVYRLEVIIPLTSFAFDSLISNSNRAAQAFPATTQYAATHDAYNTKEFSKDDLSRRHFILKVCCFFLFF